MNKFAILVVALLFGNMAHACTYSAKNSLGGDVLVERNGDSLAITPSWNPLSRAEFTLVHAKFNGGSVYNLLKEDGRIERARGTEAEYERDTELVMYEDGSIVIEPAPFEMGWIKGVQCK